MTEKPVAKKGNEYVRAILDLVILALLLIGAGFGGYYWGIHQQLAPVQAVPPGTPGALPPPAAASSSPPSPKSAGGSDSKSSSSSSEPAQPSKSGDTKSAAAEGSSKQGRHSKLKYWIASTGTEYIGYNITVNVNGDPVDSFYGPGKNVDITRMLNDGDNTITFDAKLLGEQYNKHVGDGKAVLTLQLVKGPFVQENFNKSDVVLSFQRSAVDTDDSNQSKHFTRE